MKLAIIDLDGPVVNCDARFEQAKESGRRKSITKYDGIDWDVAFDPSLIALDVPVPGAADALDFLENKGYEIMFLTSRPEDMREATVAWLHQHGFYRDYRSVIMKDYAKHRYTKTAQWKADVVRANMHFVDECLFVDDEAINRQMVDGLGLGVLCKADLSDYMDTDKPIIL